MCYDDNARPPVPPGSTGQGVGEDIILTAADGNRFSAFLASPNYATDTQIIIYPDVRGLHRFYKELALRFADVGVTALTFDYFGRTAGLTSRDEPFEYMPHVQQMQPEGLLHDLKAVKAHLDQVAVSPKPTFTMGFCMGGSLVLLTGTNPDFGFAGIIPFYSGLGRKLGAGTVLEEARNVRYPVLGLYGGADAGIPESDLKQLDEKLDIAGVEHEIVIYPGAPHSFFDRRAEDFAEASANAWQRTLDFIAKHKQPVQP
jgi:carboxymethylenebutenolidase